jgi:hypothetical protein
MVPIFTPALRFWTERVLREIFEEIFMIAPEVTPLDPMMNPVAELWSSMIVRS